MLRLFKWSSILVLCCASTFARGRVQGWCEQGVQTVQVVGLTALPKVQASYASCNITVYITGSGGSLASLYSDNNGTALDNPFTAGSDGYFFFYSNDGNVDIQYSSGGIISPFTFGGTPILDPYLYGFAPWDSPFASETLAAKAREHLSLQDFGAVGNGSTNATAAVQAAFDQASITNTALYCNPGVYSVNTITVPPNVEFYGPNQGSAVNGGGCWLKSRAAEVLLSASNATPPAQYQSGGVNHIFLDCNSVGTIGLYVGITVFNRYQSIGVKGCTKAAMAFDSTQNARVTDLDLRSSPIGLEIANGSGNNLFTRIENELITTTGMFIGLDADLPNEGQLFSQPTQNTIERSIIGDGGTYSRGLWIAQGLANHINDLNIGASQSVSLTALIQMDSPTVLNQITNMSVQMGTTDAPVLVNAGFNNRIADSDIQVKAGCTQGMTTTNFLIWHKNYVNDRCLYDNANGAFFWQYTPLFTGGATAFRPVTIPGAAIATYYNQSLFRLESFDGTYWVPTGQHFLSARASSALNPLTGSLQNIPGATVNLDVTGMWLIRGYADTICQTGDRCQLRLNLDANISHDAYYLTGGSSGQGRVMLVTSWTYNCTDCSNTPVAAQLQGALAAGSSVLSQMTGGSSHIEATYMGRQ